MYNIFDIIKGTPYWVWALFAYIIIRGVQATKARAVPLYALVIMPVVFITWSLYSLCKKYGMASIPLGLWVIFAAAGMIIGYNMMKRLTLSIDTKTKSIYLPGSWTPLLLSLVFFGIKYFLGVTYALDPAASAKALFYSLDSIVSGAVSGLSVGRLTNTLKTYFRK